MTVKTKDIRLIGLVFCGVLACFTASSVSLAKAAVSIAPKQAVLNVQGTGFAPNQMVTLSTGPAQNIQMQADNNGVAAFNNLKYAPTNNLVFSLSFFVDHVNSKPIPNNILINLDPFIGSVSVKGNATRAASIILNVSAEDSKALIANQQGQFSGQARSLSGLSGGQLKVMASIINVAEDCCPRTIVPFAPVTITISGAPIQKASADIVKTFSTANIETSTPDISFGVSVPATLINGSWVKGLYNFANRVGTYLQAETTSLGTFFEAQNNVNSMRALQQAQAKTAKSYFTSEALCRFGTMSQSLIASEELAKANKLGLSSTLWDRETGQAHTLTASGRAVTQRFDRFLAAYCDPSDFNSALRVLCKSNINDTSYNQDINYTKQVDVPMTLGVNFTNSTDSLGTDGRNIIAMGDNLFPPQPVEKLFSDPKFVSDSVTYRSLQAMRGIAKASFVNTVTEKANGTAGSGAYITNLMKSLGIPEDSASSLMGTNPSYYAQMEVLTKKLFQDPAFFVNLVESPANVARQRASIRAIKLQQQRDFAETVKRREMLLATLLELKLQQRSKMTNQSLNNTNQ